MGLSQYVITEHRGLPKRYAVDYKERRPDGRICLVNVAWCDFIHEAYRRKNEHAALMEQWTHERRTQGCGA